MTFFNKKEEVINIELTPYGRSLLAKGKLLPSYYAFFDDDILYDVVAAGATGSEDQNVIENRIYNLTPRLKPQRSLESIDGSIFNYETTEANDHPHTKVKLNYLTEPLGTSKQESDYGPSWNSLFIQGEISGNVQTTLSGSDAIFEANTQINVDIEYTMQVKNSSDLPPVSGQKTAPRQPVSEIFSDGTYLDLITEQIICQLKEEDGFVFKEGLEMQVFLYEDSVATGSTGLKPLKFMPVNSQIKNGILLDPEEESGILPSLDPSYVSYWMNFNFDSEIPDADICAGLQELKSQDIQLELEIDCPDDDSVDFDIYGTRITEADVEKCE